MKTREHSFFNRFVEQLEISTVWLQHDPPCALWLDQHRRLNSSCIHPFLPDSSLWRVTINKGKEPHALPQESGAQWPDRQSPARSDWRFELTCLEAETPAFAAWLAALINRREGLLARLPAPPSPLLNWSDVRKLDDYLYYLSSVSLWSEEAFIEDIKWSRRPALHGLVARGPVLSLTAAH